MYQMEKITAEEYRDRFVNKKTTKSKYKNVKFEVDDKKFDSKAEGARYKQLKFLEKFGEITGLVSHVKFQLVTGVVYECDFLYYDIQSKKWLVEDVKGYKTQEYKTKKKLMKELLGIEVLET